MSSIDDIFDAPVEKKEKAPSVRLSLDYESKNFARFRLVNDLRKSDKHPEAKKMKLVIRHYVKGVGYVTCGQNVGTKKNDKDETVPQLWSTTFIKTKEEAQDWQKPFIQPARNGGFIVPACKFCLERSEFKKACGGDAKMTKDQSKEHQNLHRRTINLVAEAEVEIRDENGKLVEGPMPKSIHFNAIDLFFPQQEKQYKQLQSKFNKDKTLLDKWYTLDTAGQIDSDDKVSAEDRKRKVSVDLSYVDKETKSYADGLKQYLGKSNSAAEAEPMEVDEDEIPFDLEDDDKPSF